MKVGSTNDELVCRAAEIMATDTVIAEQDKKLTWQLPRYYRVEPCELEAWYVWREDQTQFDIIFVPFAGRVLLVKPLFRLEVENGQSVAAHPSLVDIVSTVGPTKFSQSDLLATSTSNRKVHLALGLSLNCNLSCLYCHAEAQTGCALRMDRELLLRTIEDAIEQAHIAGGLVVSFTAGGEPTYEWDLFTLAVEAAHERCSVKGIPLKLLVTTNGVYGLAHREYIARYFSGVTLSVDGLPHVHDYQRPTSRGRPSFHFVWKTAKHFSKRQVRFGIRATVTELGVKTMSDFVKLVAEELGRIPVAFEPMVPVGRGQGAIIGGSLKPVDPQEFCEQFWLAHVEGERLGVKVSTSTMNLEKKFRPCVVPCLFLPLRLWLRVWSLPAIETAAGFWPMAITLAK